MVIGIISEVKISALKNKSLAQCDPSGQGVKKPWDLRNRGADDVSSWISFEIQQEVKGGSKNESAMLEFIFLMHCFYCLLRISRNGIGMEVRRAVRRSLEQSRWSMTVAWTRVLAMGSQSSEHKLIRVCWWVRCRDSEEK